MKDSTSLSLIKRTGFCGSVLFIFSVISVICGIICSFKMYYAAAVYNNIAILPIYDFEKIIRNLLSADILLLLLISISFFSGICVILNYAFLFSASFLNCYTLCVFYTYSNSFTTEIVISSLLASVGIVIMCHIATEACKFSLKSLGRADGTFAKNSGAAVLKIIRIILEFSVSAFFIIAAAVFLKNGGK